MRESTYNKSGPGRCANTTIRDLDTTQPWELVMPYPDLTPAPPADTTPAHMRPHFDGCPECGTRWNVPTHTQPANGPTPGCLSTYTCRECQHAWTCSWACDGVG